MKNTIINILLLTLFFVGSAPVFSQVGIGTTNPDASAILDVTATDKGLLLPRVASTSAIASPTNGLFIYDISDKCVKIFRENAWSNCLGVNIPPVVTALECSTATTVGTLTAGSVSSGVSFTVNYTGGNQVAYPGEIIASTGITGLTAVSVGGTLANGSGSVTYTISGTPSGIIAGTASFAITIGTQSCTVNIVVLKAEPQVTALYCGSPTIVGSLVAGTAASGVTFTVNYSGGNGLSYTGETVNALGITGLTATAAAGTLATGSGNITYTVSDTPDGVLAGTASFIINIGGQSCNVNLEVLEAEPTITTLDCAGATIVGTLEAGTAASGVTFTVPYTGANGVSYTGETVNSTGSTGLTATLLAGNLATGSGTLTYTVTGTAATVSTANFAISCGGQSCSVGITVNCSTLLSPINTTIVEIISPSGQIWMDRNLGAENVGDYGDYYQWGRSNDGHQLATSCTTAGPVVAGTEGRNFITTSAGPSDWLSPQDATRWNAGTETNPIKTQYDPCPSGYRVPTQTELSVETNNISSLNLTNGYIRLLDGSLVFAGRYWTSSTSGTTSYCLAITDASSSTMGTNTRSRGNSVRCIKE